MPPPNKPLPPLPTRPRSGGPPSRPLPPLPGSQPPNKPLPLTPPQQEAQALRMIEQQRQQNLRLMFATAKIQLKGKEAALASAEMMKNVSGLVKEVRTLKGVAPGVSTMAAKAVTERFLTDLTAAGSLGNLATLVPGLNPAKIIGDVMPVVGSIKAGYDLLKNLYECGDALHTHYKVVKGMPSVLPGDPAAAARAVQTMLKITAADKGSAAAVAGAKFGTSVASLPADGGATANIVFAAVEMAKSLFMLGLSIKEMVQGNQHLKTGALDATLFKSSPLAGCYLMVNSNTSDVLAFLTPDIGTIGWMDRVEEMKKQVDPCIESARGFIHDSKLEIVALPMNKVGKHKGFFTKVFDAFSA